MHIIVRSGVRVAAGAGLFGAGVVLSHPPLPFHSYALAAAAAVFVGAAMFVFGWHCSRTSLVIYRDRPVHHAALLPPQRSKCSEPARSPAPRVLDQNPATLEVVDSAAPPVLAHYDELANQRRGR